ncbi:MAG: M6 family metalloprotease domain-containing protein, partial [Candidatus Cloacimonetes bacterium]|nr:M6 family metalloprotease domain-containing protein [Candidatus Cloacimonadota bacterium]
MKKILIFLIISLHFIILNGAFLENIPMTIIQPDGETFSCFASGDEFFNRLHDEEGFTIIQSSEDGYYYYAIWNGEQIVASVFRVGSIEPAAAGLMPNLMIPATEYQARRKRYLSHVTSSRAPTSGTINNIVVYIRFSNQTEFSYTREFYDLKFNDDTLGAESMYSYYQEVSYNVLTIDSYHYPVCELDTNLSYQDSHPRGYFSPYNPVTNPIGYENDTQKTQREHQLLADAIAFIACEVPVDLDLDGDSDGEVDNVCFIIRGGNDGWSDLLWAHRWVLYSMFVYLNGKRVYGYTFQPESQVDVSTLNHEMFHALGAPDLYHYSDAGANPNGPFSAWDIMNGANVHMSAYMKYRYGNWIDEIPELTESGIYSLSPLTSSLNNCYKISSPNCTYEYFVVEYRKQVPNTFEMHIPGSGLIVSRVNTLCDGQGNGGGPPDELYLFRPGGSPTTDGNVSIAHFSSDYGRTEFNDYSDPYCFLSNGNLGGIFIHQVGTAGDYISFIFDPQIGFFNGTVTSDNPEVDITETEITIDGIVLNPNPYGNFEYAHWQGAYDITAYLHGHTIDAQVLEILPMQTVSI